MQLVSVRGARPRHPGAFAPSCVFSGGLVALGSLLRTAAHGQPLPATIESAFSCAAAPAGLYLPIALDRLVHGIYIDPYAPEWFEKVVRDVVVRFAPRLRRRITWSSMKADPLF